MKLPHLFIHTFLFSCFISVQSMDKKIPLYSTDDLKIKTVHNCHTMLGYIKNQNLTLNNAGSALFEKFGEKYAETVHAPLKFNPTPTYQPGINFEQALLILVAAIPDIQKVILTHMGFTGVNTQQSFLNIPLSQALEWYAECCNTPTTCLEDISANIRSLLSNDHYYCLKNLILESQITRETDEYVDEKTEKPVRNFALISDAQKQLLCTLPGEFVLNEKARTVLSKIVISYKQPKLNNTANTLLHLFLNVPRETYTSHYLFNPVSSRNYLCLGLTGVFFSIFYFSNNVKTLYSLSPLIIFLCSNSCSTMIRKLIVHRFDNVGLIKSPTSLITRDNFATSVVTSLYIMSQGLIGIPLPYIFSGLVTAFAPFMAYDYFMHGVKYGIKTQSILDLINTPACPKKSFCTLL